MEVTIQILICIMIADFFTGLFHWLEDTYGTPDIPIVGKYVIAPNIDHHKNPGNLGTQGSFFTRTRISFLLTAPIILLFYFFGHLTWHVWVIAGLTAIGNQVHAFAHGACKKNKVLKFLHKFKIIQTPKNHAKHHVPPFDKDFCVLTNFVNPILETIRFWKIIEILLAVFFELTPKRMSKERGYL